MIAESKSYEASLFRQNCAICHGTEAEGRTLFDGTVVPNLRQGEFKYKTDAQIYQHIADGDIVAGQETGSIDDAHHRAGDVERPFVVHARHLRRLPAEQCATCGFTGRGRTDHHLGHLIGVESTGGDVVEEEKRPRRMH